MNWRNRLAPLLSTAGLAWCAVAGGLVWFTPLKYTGTYDGVPSVRYRSFSEMSGVTPLIIPVLIAAVAAWAAWRGHRATLGVAAFLLVAFTLITGFSIGATYLPADGLLLLATGLGAAFGSGQPKFRTAGLERPRN